MRGYYDCACLCFSARAVYSKIGYRVCFDWCGNVGYGFVGRDFDEDDIFTRVRTGLQELGADGSGDGERG